MMRGDDEDGIGEVYEKNDAGPLHGLDSGRVIISEVRSERIHRRFRYDRGQGCYTTCSKLILMGSMEIHSMIRSRVAMLTADNPDLSIEDDVEDGGWGLLTIRERGNLVGFEFLETEGSWRRPTALLQYVEASNDGFYVGVLVPQRCLELVTDLVRSGGEGTLVLNTYEELGVAPMQYGH